MQEKLRQHLITKQRKCSNWHIHTHRQKLTQDMLSHVCVCVCALCIEWNIVFILHYSSNCIAQFSHSCRLILQFYFAEMVVCVVVCYFSLHSIYCAHSCSWYCYAARCMLAASNSFVSLYILWHFHFSVFFYFFFIFWNHITFVSSFLTAAQARFNVTNAKRKKLTHSVYEWYHFLK